MCGCQLLQHTKESTPMRTLSIGQRIANAAVGLTGTYGAVTNQAKQTGCSRQCIYDHTQKVVEAVEAQHRGGPTLEEAVCENNILRRENAELWNWLFQTIEFPLLTQQRFTAVARSMGISLNQTLVLLGILLGARAVPSRSTIHRWAQAADAAAGVVLKRLDRACQTLVLVGCLDEIFFRRQPVLVGIEPMSMVWFLGKKVASHNGLTWFAELQPWTSLSYVTSDAGAGLKAGIARMQKLRDQTNQVSLEKGLDVFHTKREGQRALRVVWMRVEQAWNRADAADRALKQARWQGRGERKLTQQVHEAWTKAFSAFKLYEKREAVWIRAHSALDVFRPDGQLNDRAWRKSKSRGRCRGFRDRNGPRSAGFFRIRSHSHSWIACTTSWIDCRCPKRRVTPLYGYGGCGGKCPGNRPRRRSEVMAKRLLWCSKFSVPSWTRTGVNRIVNSRPYCVRRCGPAARWSA